MGEVNLPLLPHKKLLSKSPALLESTRNRIFGAKNNSTFGIAFPMVTSDNE